MSGKGFRNGSRIDGGAGGGEMQEHSLYRPIEYYFYLGDSFGACLSTYHRPSLHYSVGGGAIYYVSSSSGGVVAQKEYQRCRGVTRLHHRVYKLSVL